MRGGGAGAGGAATEAAPFPLVQRSAVQCRRHAAPLAPRSTSRALGRGTRRVGGRRRQRTAAQQQRQRQQRSSGHVGASQQRRQGDSSRARAADRTGAAAAPPAAAATVGSRVEGGRQGVTVRAPLAAGAPPMAACVSVYVFLCVLLRGWGGHKGCLPGLSGSQAGLFQGGVVSGVPGAAGRVAPHGGEPSPVPHPRRHGTAEHGRVRVCGWKEKGLTWGSRQGWHAARERQF